MNLKSLDMIHMAETPPLRVKLRDQGCW